MEANKKAVMEIEYIEYVVKVDRATSDIANRSLSRSLIRRSDAAFLTGGPTTLTLPLTDKVELIIDGEDGILLLHSLMTDSTLGLNGWQDIQSLAEALAIIYQAFDR